MEGSLIFSLSLHALTNGSSSAKRIFVGSIQSSVCFCFCFSFACLFVFVFFAINVEVFSLSHRIIKAELPSDQQDFWNCHNGYNDNRQE